MTLADFPYLHFMVRSEDAEGHPCLLTVAEAAETGSPGGCFVAPVNDEGRFFPFYRFHFSVYQGGGKYLEQLDKKSIFEGLAVSKRTGSKSDSLVCTFPLRELQSLLKSSRQEFEFPSFRRMPGRSLLAYGGKLKNHDFRFLLAELAPIEPAALDNLLDASGISLIGCVDDANRRQTKPKAKRTEQKAHR